MHDDHDHLWGPWKAACLGGLCLRQWRCADCVHASGYRATCPSWAGDRPPTRSRRCIRETWAATANEAAVGLAGWACRPPRPRNCQCSRPPDESTWNKDPPMETISPYKVDITYLIPGGLVTTYTTRYWKSILAGAYVVWEITIQTVPTMGAHHRE